MKKIILTYCITLAIFSQEFDQKSVLDDLNYLYNSLEQTHYDLYAFTTKEAFKRNFELIRSSIIADSLNLLEVTSLFQRVISKANTGHAEIDFPATVYRSYAANSGTVFPLELAFENGKAYIRRNFSRDSTLAKGSEVIQINGKQIHEILEQLYPQLSAETEYFKLAKLEFWSFPRLYWQVFGEVDSFRVQVKQNDQLSTIQLKAIPLVEEFEMKRDDVIRSSSEFKLFKNAAYIRAGNFSGDIATFKNFVDSSFEKVRDSKLNTLIIDLRNNAGGHDEFSNYLVSYIADKPFMWNSSFKVKTSALLKAHTRTHNDTTHLYFRKILDMNNGEIFSEQFEHTQPQKLQKRFTGKIYVLINRQSHSMAAVTAATIQDYKFGTLVGEETGDHPSLHASQFSYTLPLTKIRVKVPKGYLTRPNGNTNRRGVRPNIFIQDHLIDDDDEILKALLKGFK